MAHDVEHKQDGSIVVEHDHGQQDAKAQHHTSSAHSHHFNWRQAISLVFCSGGILVCYLWFGIVQEAM
ncbi:unnamed protein product [Anisakis simplex]|uniref:Cytochrome o ubiquinol oxidase subunit IV n=1 Tax=Anisakis simplex TaxID=6269 RepID=A0A0M3JMW3_ANISI|nr:unnamed protein product [Anisakis simplex]